MQYRSLQHEKFRSKPHPTKEAFSYNTLPTKSTVSLSWVYSPHEDDHLPLLVKSKTLAPVTGCVLLFHSSLAPSPQSRKFEAIKALQFGLLLVSRNLNVSWSSHVGARYSSTSHQHQLIIIPLTVTTINLSVTWVTLIVLQTKYNNHYKTVEVVVVIFRLHDETNDDPTKYIKWHDSSTFCL